MASGNFDASTSEAARSIEIDISSLSVNDSIVVSIYTQLTDANANSGGPSTYTATIRIYNLTITAS